MGRAAKVLLIAVALAAGVYLLFTVVFPWVDATFVTDPVLEGRSWPAATRLARGAAAALSRSG